MLRSSPPSLLVLVLPWRAAVPTSNRGLDPAGGVTDDPPPCLSPGPSAANPPSPPPTPLIPLVVHPHPGVRVWACVRLVLPVARPLTRSSMAGTASSSPPGCGGKATEVVAMMGKRAAQVKRGDV